MGTWLSTDNKSLYVARHHILAQHKEERWAKAQAQLSQMRHIAMASSMDTRLLIYPPGGPGHGQQYSMGPLLMRCFVPGWFWLPPGYLERDQVGHWGPYAKLLSSRCSTRSTRWWEARTRFCISTKSTACSNE